MLHFEAIKIKFGVVLSILNNKRQLPMLGQTPCTHYYISYCCDQSCSREIYTIHIILHILIQQLWLWPSSLKDWLPQLQVKQYNDRNISVQWSHLMVISFSLQLCLKKRPDNCTVVPMFERSQVVSTITIESYYQLW